MSKLIVLILLHVLGDSLLLGKNLRKLKIEKISYLFKHVGIYTAIFLVLTPLLLSLTILQSLTFSLIIGFFHLVVDYSFIQLKKIFWKSGKYQYVALFSAIEHLIHISILIAIFLYMFPNAVDVSGWGNVVKYYFLQKPV